MSSYASRLAAIAGKATVIIAPDRDTRKNGKTVFLAGSIDMGTAEDWQTRAIKQLNDLDITIYNPRRTDWDPTWKQDPSFPPFKDQVIWELENLEQVDVVMMYIAPDSKSPISLLELGLFGRSQRMVVGCPEGFFRRGNIQIVCERYAIELVDNFDALVAATRHRLLETTNTQGI